MSGKDVALTAGIDSDHRLLRQGNSASKGRLETLYSLTPCDQNQLEEASNVIGNNTADRSGIHAYWRHPDLAP